MPGLRNLQLFGNLLANTGLKVILDNCPNLEHLDLRQCLNVHFVGDLEKQCSERIKVLRRPNDSTHDYLYDVLFYDTDSSGDDYPEDDDSYPYDFTSDEDNYFPASYHPDYYLYDIDDCPFEIDVFGFTSL
ncbi:unnamed protein product [Eruca vesicaria subsp. sativa]|uniref:Uncharacterized protein n=1 Tax=Eruca vesicaria subsp. sativa TaxID=29727 RepID=A0ABC8LPY8_ERUVS|nr:unnamed protein product [Eruca vesicaria subsp. sativa]